MWRIHRLENGKKTLEATYQDIGLQTARRFLHGIAASEAAKLNSQATSEVGIKNNEQIIYRCSVFAPPSGSNTLLVAVEFVLECDR